MQGKLYLLAHVTLDKFLIFHLSSPVEYQPSEQAGRNKEIFESWQL